MPLLKGLEYEVLRSTIDLTNEESVDKFCDKYIVDKKLVKDSLQHLHHLEVKKIKKTARKAPQISEGR